MSIVKKCNKISGFSLSRNQFFVVGRISGCFDGILALLHVFFFSNSLDFHFSFDRRSCPFLNYYDSRVFQSRAPIPTHMTPCLICNGLLFFRKLKKNVFFDLIMKMQ